MEMTTCRQKGAGDAAARKKKRGRPKRRYLDVVKEDMREVGKVKCITEVYGESKQVGHHMTGHCH